MSNKPERYLGEIPPQARPNLFKPELIPAGQLAHAGIFTPDLLEYYYTLSNPEFSQFDVMCVTNVNGGWSPPRQAFFNSSDMDHGVHFTEDGQWVYFSSTRPVDCEGITGDWHIWRCKKQAPGWSEPIWVNVPGMESRIMSHPSLSRSNRLYFHSYNTDFSDMALFVSESIDGQFQAAKKLEFPEGFNKMTLASFVAPDESYILFTKKFADFRTHETHIAYRDVSRNKDEWLMPSKLTEINDKNLGNPYVTPDGQYLFYATGNWPEDKAPSDWVINWVNTKKLINFHQ